MLTRNNVLDLIEKRYEQTSIARVLFDDLLERLPIKEILNDPAGFEKLLQEEMTEILVHRGAEALKIGAEFARKI